MLLLLEAAIAEIAGSRVPLELTPFEDAWSAVVADAAGTADVDIGDAGRCPRVSPCQPGSVQLLGSQM